MASKKKTEGQDTTEITMQNLLRLYRNCQAVYEEGLFGWTIDSKIKRIGKSAKEAIEYKIGEELTANYQRRKEIEDELREPYKDVPYDKANDVEYKENLKKNKEFVDLYKREEEMWKITLPDFLFVPVKVKITDDVNEKITKPERMITFRDRPFPVGVYAALGDLIDDGYIVETT